MPTPEQLAEQFNIDETAEALGMSPATVEREWALAKAWLFRRLSPPE